MLYGHDQGKNMKQLCDGQTDAVCISKGGTGATTKAVAKENLGITMSTSEPTAAEGDDGDIWIVYEA